MCDADEDDACDADEDEDDVAACEDVEDEGAPPLPAEEVCPRGDEEQAARARTATATGVRIGGDCTAASSARAVGPGVNRGRYPLFWWRIPCFRGEMDP